MTSNDANERRLGPDRRRRPTRPWDVFFHGRRRSRHRRDYDVPAGSVGFVDRHPIFLGFMAIALLLLTITDGVFTVLLLDADCEEFNPVMAYMLERGVHDFLVAKYVLTVTGTVFLLSLRTYPLFGTRFRVAHVLPVLVALYVLLLGYQAYLYGLRPATKAVATRGPGP